MDGQKTALAAAFHAGERDAQERAGVRAQMERVGAAVLRGYMPEQHREFFPLLPTLFAGAQDGEGRLWASMLCGRPGFIRSPDPVSLRIDARFDAHDPLAAALSPGAQVGLLGLQFETRRRNRANGSIVAVDDAGFAFALRQSFGNCPKYIQKRELRVPGALPAPLPDRSGGALLPPAALALIARADTFFIATAAEAAAGTAHGVDVSHRGGRPGFVQAAASGDLSWPDFQGNNFFNTIGNLLADGRAGLLFIDFEQGHLLQLSGHAEVVWRGAEVDAFPGAKRLLRFRTLRHVLRPHALPLRWTLVEPSPHLDATGAWR
ncbi:MAG TPA: pyridoxamine 5'-phosphate oxidase family protein [Noviherbaspirillum sp.]|uniref:pyridoxamine 5'-phosphate oxidase family protein n=1 Tax=Noviherbaspirillum sp. TaxID=1926288 RepID=UPI002D29BAD5|nr:pyridoxamine 5'-phosphate oxidase family protein [Noviherbaspirillum sp.]HYD97013.1 pyridoxamine 5'-phosphate oxidase family protein [Noviherbaspirillum sp.]